MSLCPASSEKISHQKKPDRDENREGLSSGVFPVETELLCNLTAKFYFI